MNRQQAENLHRYERAAINAGMSFAMVEQVRRDAMRLHRWYERECNGEVTRAEEGDTYNDRRGEARRLEPGKTYSVLNTDGPGPLRYTRCPDAETGAEKRIRAAAEAIGATVEIQGDPRGWPVEFTARDGVRFSPPMRA